MPFIILVLGAATAAEGIINGKISNNRKTYPYLDFLW